MRDLLEKGREEDHLLDDVLGQNVPNKLSAD